MSYPGSPRLGSLPMSSPAAYSADSDRGSNPSHSESSSGAKISPAVLITIVILAVLFFISGLLHLLVRFLSRQPSPTNSVPNRPPEVDESDVLQRQLQHLFDLHDTGLDQTAIDALPVFHLKELVGLKDQFDCAVCLCEFSFNDKLRLLPTCGHAFHINCIDTWLQSNSTCPLCRSTLFPIDSAMFDFDDSSFPPNNVETDYSEDPMDEMNGSKGVLPVHLGKFRKVNVEVDSSVEETSNSHIDARRCYSMGSYQYILGHENLRIALGTYSNQCIKKDGEEEEVMGRNSILGSRGDSLSVSKTWLWSGKNRYKNSLDTHHEGIFPEVSWVARGAM